jgi:hypothetical protein
MFHSDQRARTRGYSMRFPGTIFPENWDNPNDALFLIPLAQILAAFPPSGHSGKIAELISLSGGALDDLQAMEFLNEFYRIRFTQLDYSPDSNRVGRKPLAIHDLSRIASHRMSALANDYGLNQSPRANDAADFLLRLRESLPSWNSGQYGDLADLAVTGQYYLDNNAVEISNLDERLAATDPDYVMRVLFGVLYYYLKVFSPGAYDFTHVQNTLAFLRQIDIKFGFTTFDPNLAAQIQRLNPSSQNQFYYPPYTDGEVPEFPGQEWLSRGYRTPPNAFLFNMEQIIDLARANPEIFRQSTNLFLHNRWARHLMLTNPDIF